MMQQFFFAILFWKLHTSHFLENNVKLPAFKIIFWDILEKKKNSAKILNKYNLFQMQSGHSKTADPSNYISFIISLDYKLPLFYLIK
jgi:hypothetical protein